MNLKYLLLLALCVVGAIAHRTRENDNQKRLQRSDQDNALAAVSDSDVSSLEEDALAEPLPDDANHGKNGKRKNRRWRKNKCRNETKTEGAAEDGENNNEQGEVKCERCRGRGCRRRGNKDKKDSSEEDSNKNKHDRHHHHHHHCNKTESDGSVHSQDGNFERHHHGWRKHGHKNQTDDQDNNQIENEEGKRGRHRQRGYHHRENTNENGEFVHDPEWHKNHNVPMPEGDSDVSHRRHHHHHHHHHCHNRTTTTSTTPIPHSTSVAPSNDDSVTELDVIANVE
jgi:hypothetical protein